MGEMPSWSKATYKNYYENSLLFCKAQGKICPKDKNRKTSGKNETENSEIYTSLIIIKLYSVLF
ncbi:hypothetical protein SAMN05216383_12337 [Prevotella sp. KH2C16]|nr:hypothetical protein SAMN05216383_12337 [Prevotella sp. KH2C16]